MSKDTVKKRAYFMDKLIRYMLVIFSLISIITTILIVFTLFGESFVFFKEVSIKEFLTGTLWSPVIKPQKFGVLPLLVGSLLIAIISGIISIPIGLGSAIYLSEYSSDKLRKILKPILEILAGIPSIVYGFFALTFITPLFRRIIPNLEIFNALSAGIAVGIMTIPMVASLSEDAMRAVPNAMREGAYGLGSTTFEVSTKVVIPAALSGIVSSFILAISRAIGETMIVAIAAGANPSLNFNPLKTIQTMTGFMVNVSLGDIPHGSIEYRTLFAVGALLFIMTFIMNIIAKVVINRYREEY
ncbi:phosphate ABC transporter membrane protein 1 (PhoT family) [Hypnocyclicus thermotrophus]|uniref:Phosphate transport system permease protein n=1 Tax=Hypnocyclicus thermotrophus TaxID=1627895 RepID=A0AA46I5Q4_9FUSO|nr:phosphate ABC transporter permease subunit PstC [Hypnocyclicus thermotrophus]TDT70553.1 phosphate ABC transporter membrane protein 1 (PhoT family) [Hypnocyclicus thermotrophus]